ncbi:melanopsin-B-like [Hydra vulgaris]|uniref:melanopsin-B-like n=1 Tax=Hydra vulgaris TaxID=6087 RepID=UPI001F5E6053|nr:melanopsin-B-like [Hydra vulgaris]
MNAVKTALLIVSSIATITNAVSLFFLYRKHKNNYVILCINLSLSDLVRSIAGYIPALFLETNLNRASTLCKLSAFFIAFSSFTTIAMLTAIALSRMILLSTCFLHSQINYKTLFIKIGFFAWIYGFTWAVMPFFGFSSYTLENTCTRCSIDFFPKTKVEKVYLILLIAFGFLIPIITILSSCLYTANVMRSQYNYFYMIYGKNNVETKKYKVKEKKAFSSFILMVLSFVVCWTPYATVGCFSAFTSLEIPKWLLHFAPFFGKCSALVNPIIYCWKDSLLSWYIKSKRSLIIKLLFKRSEDNLFTCQIEKI